MRNKTVFKLGYFFIIGLVITIVFCFFIQWYQTSVFDEKPVSISSELKSDYVSVTFEGVNEYTDMWKTVLQVSDDPYSIQEFYGATFSTTIENNQSHKIKDWILRQNIETECYLNKFWCGSYEIHQYRNGEEIVETVDSRTVLFDELKLDHNPYSDVMMIHLLPGDYLIYYPSAENMEDVVDGNSNVGIGCILYFRDEIELSDTVITYYNDRKITDGFLFDAIVVMLYVLGFFTLIHVVSIVTYHRTKKAIDAVTQSVINGLSYEYNTLWLIHVKNKTIQLVRNHDREDINKAVLLAKDFTDYDTTINYYINHYVDKKDRERVRKEVSFENLIRHLSSENFFTVNYLHHPYDSECIYFQMAFTKTTSGGTDEDIVLAYRDIDHFVREEQEKKRQLEAALLQAREADKTKTIFLANMSHEIRTPINAILGMDTMILRESNEENVKEYAKDIKNASNTLLSLVNDILDFSKIESGNMEIVTADYRLDSVIKDLINMIKPKAEEKNLVFNLEIDPGTPAQLVGDEIRVKQIILNLLSNAVKYTKTGSVTWSIGFDMISESACKLKVSVKDTGIGIKESDLEKITSPYMRFDMSENRSIEGTGLGLNITKNLLQKMGGDLLVESVYGEGSVFSFEIEQRLWGREQVGDQQNDTREEEEMTEKFHAPTADILVVDDVEMNIIVVKNLLKRIEIHPETCLSGMEALELSKKKKYDLILLDAMMPKMNGKETLCQIRKQSKCNKDTPIVVLTANAVLGAREEYLAEGFTNYLSKPVNGQILEDMIETYLPKGKIVYLDSEKKEKKEDISEKKSGGDDELCDRLSELGFLDVSAGIAAAGGRGTYIRVCENFCETSAARMQMIQDYYGAKDFENYEIQTHALKSSARLIGALELSELALAMEMAAKAKDEAGIDQETQRLLDLYGTVCQGIMSVFDTQKHNGEEVVKQELSPKKLKRKLEELQELVKAFDYESSNALLKKLEEYQLPDAFIATYKALKLHMAEVDYESVIREINTFLEEGGRNHDV